MPSSQALSSAPASRTVGKHQCKRSSSQNNRRYQASLTETEQLSKAVSNRRRCRPQHCRASLLSRYLPLHDPVCALLHTTWTTAFAQGIGGCDDHPCDGLIHTANSLTPTPPLTRGRYCGGDRQCSVNAIVLPSQQFPLGVFLTYERTNELNPPPPPHRATHYHKKLIPRP